jgi:phage-related minor tail protein
MSSDVELTTLGIGIKVDGEAQLTSLEKSTKSLTGSQAELQRQNAAMTQSSVTSAAATKTVEAATSSAADAAAKFTAGQAFLIEKLQEQAATVGMTKSQLMEYQAVAMGLPSTVYSPLIAKLKEAESAQNSHGFSMQSSLAKVEALRIGHDALIGSYNRMASSAFVLGNATGATNAILGALLNPLTLIGIGVIAVGAAFIAGARQQEEFDKSLIISGNQAGLTNDRLQQLTTTMSDVGRVSIGAARTGLEALASTGKFTATSIDTVAAAMLTYTRVSGEKSEEVVKHFEKMADGVTKWAEAENKQLGFLSVAQYEHIRLLEEQGQKQQAMAELGRLVDDALKDNETQLGHTQSAWEKIGIAAKNAWDAFLGIGRDHTIADQIGDVQNRMSVRAQNFAVGRGGLTAKDKSNQDFGDLQELQLLNAQLDSVQTAAESKAAESADKVAGVVASGYMKKVHEHEKGTALVKEKLDQYDRMLADYQKNGGEVSTDQQAIDRAKITKDNMPHAGAKPRDPANNIVQGQLQQQAQDMAQAKQALDEQQKMNDLAHKYSLSSDKDYYQQKRDIEVAYDDIKQKDLQQQIAIREAQKPKDAAEGERIKNEIAALQAKLVLEQRDVTFKSQQYQIEEALRGPQNDFNKLLKEEASVKETLTKGQQDLNILKQGGALADIDYLIKSGDLNKDAVTQLEALRQKMLAIASANPMNAKMQEDVKKVGEEIRNTADKTDLLGNKFRTIGENQFSTFFSSVITGTQSVKQAFGGMVTGILAEMAKLFAQKASAGLMAQLFGGAPDTSAAAANASSFDAGNFPDLVPKAKGAAYSRAGIQAFASGGAFTNGIATQPTTAPMALFGEAGPEAIMPLTRGPDGSLGVKSSGGGGGGGLVFNNIYNIDSRTDAASIQQMLVQASKQMQSDIQSQIKRGSTAYVRG